MRGARSGEETSFQGEKENLAPAGFLIPCQPSPRSVLENSPPQSNINRSMTSLIKQPQGFILTFACILLRLQKCCSSLPAFITTK